MQLSPSYIAGLEYTMVQKDNEIVAEATGDASELLLDEMDVLRVVSIMERNTFVHYPAARADNGATRSACSLARILAEWD